MLAAMKRADRLVESCCRGRFRLLGLDGPAHLQLIRRGSQAATQGVVGEAPVQRRAARRLRAQAQDLQGAEEEGRSQNFQPVLGCW